MNIFLYMVKWGLFAKPLRPPATTTPARTAPRVQVRRLPLRSPLPGDVVDQQSPRGASVVASRHRPVRVTAPLLPARRGVSPAEHPLPEQKHHFRSANHNVGTNAALKTNDAKTPECV